MAPVLLGPEGLGLPLGVLVRPLVGWELSTPCDGAAPHPRYRMPPLTRTGIHVRGHVSLIFVQAHKEST